MGYNAEKHGNSEGKILSRQDINEYFIELSRIKSIKKMAIVTLPADIGRQEIALQQQMQAEGVDLALTCVEGDADTFQRTKELPLNNATFVHSPLEDLHYKPRSFDGFFADFCGNLLGKNGYTDSSMETFVRLLRVMLKNRGIGFITFAMFPTRLMDKIKMYKRLTGKKVDDITYNQMMKEYIDELNKYLPDNCKVCYSLRYKSGSKYAFGVIGVCKGYDAKVQHIDLIDNFADLEQDEQMTAISKAYEILSPFIFVDVNERIEELYPNASKRTKEMYKKRHARQVAEMTLLMPTSSRIKRTIKKIRKGEVVETAKTKKPRKPTKKQKAKAKEHSRNKTLAVKVRNHLKDGLTPKEIIIVMNIEEAKLKGVLAGMSRGTYGDVNQNFMRRRKVYKMFRKGWTDEKIYKHCNWLDPKTLQLAGFKAGYKRLCNKNGVDFKFPKKMASAPVKKAKKDTPVEEATVEEAGKWKLNDNASSRIFTDEDNRVIRQQLDKDSSIAFIAYFIGKNYQTVWSHIKKNFTKQEKPSTECVTPVPAEEHILVWDRHENKRKNGQQIVNLRNQGKSNKEVADELDMGYSTVCAFVQHHCSKVLRSDMIKELEASTVKKKKKQKKEDKAIYQPMKPRMIVVKGKRVKEPMYDGIRIAAMINEGKKPKEVAKILKISLNNLLFFTQYHIIFVTVNKTNNEEQGETK